MILNLTQHKATPDQVSAGVEDVDSSKTARLHGLLTFDELPTRAEIDLRAAEIADIAAWHGATTAMIGGAPWLMAPLADELKAVGIRPVFAFTLREVSEVAQPDGSTRKVAVFRHAGWIDA